MFILMLPPLSRLTSHSGLGLPISSGWAEKRETKAVFLRVWWCYFSAR